MDAARARIASDPSVGRAPAVGPALQALSDAKARLPLKMRGLGQTSAVLLSPIAFSGHSIAKASHLAITPPLAADDCYSYCLADLSLQPWQDGG